MSRKPEVWRGVLRYHPGDDEPFSATKKFYKDDKLCCTVIPDGAVMPLENEIRKRGEDVAGVTLRSEFDNLAIMLCTYFDSHPDCPEDEEINDESWKPWVVDRCNEMLDAIRKHYESAFDAMREVKP